MGWKGTIRAIEADMRRSARENARQKKQEAKLQALDDAANAVEAFEEYLEQITTMHRECNSEKIDWEEKANIKAPIEPKRKRDNQKAAKERHDNFKPNILHKIFKREGKVKKRLHDLIVSSSIEDEKIYEDKISTYHSKHKEWEKDNSLAKGVVGGDYIAYIETIERLNPFINISNLGSEISFGVDDKGNVTAKINVHSDEVIPKEKYSLRQSGALSTKNMPKGEFYELYQDYVCSSVIRVAVELFALLPIDRLKVNANDNILNKNTGHIEDQTILSVIVMRKTLYGLNLNAIDPSDSMKNFLHNMKFKKTTGFAIVEQLSFDKIK